jgi:hypothetical protein
MWRGSDRSCAKHLAGGIVLVIRSVYRTTELPPTLFDLIASLPVADRVKHADKEH